MHLVLIVKDKGRSAEIIIVNKSRPRHSLTTGAKPGLLP